MCACVPYEDDCAGLQIAVGVSGTDFPAELYFTSSCSSVVIRRACACSVYPACRSIMCSFLKNRSQRKRRKKKWPPLAALAVNISFCLANVLGVRVNILIMSPGCWHAHSLRRTCGYCKAKQMKKSCGSVCVCACVCACRDECQAGLKTCSAIAGAK